MNETKADDRERFTSHARDFTEQAYRHCLKVAKARFTFERFGTTSAEPHVLWRHDLDYSVHRARRLAQIEHEEGAIATYFIYLGSNYFNPLSEPVRNLLREIAGLGHDFGVHFDIEMYGSLNSHEYLSKISYEREILNDLTGKDPVAISFHKYGFLKYLPSEDDIIGGLVNAYSAHIKRSYVYNSDSFGVWRYRRLIEVLEDRSIDRLQVLTHPEWWTPTVMQPGQRIERAIDGYTQFLASWYRDFLASSKFPDIR